jgi:hypothetical protein
VTEAEWLGATDPVPMLKFLYGKTDDRRFHHHPAIPRRAGSQL